MLDVRADQGVAAKITPKTETLLGEVCTAVKHLDESLDTINFSEAYRYREQANFHNQDASMPDMSLGDLLSWINNFACTEGPELARQQPAGEALVKGRARQLQAMLKPLAARVAEITDSPSYRGNQPFVFYTLAHPKVYWAFDELCTRLALLAR